MEKKLTLMPLSSRCGTPSKVPYKKTENRLKEYSSSSSLALKCKNTANEIKRRDEMRENRSITRELLIQKFTNKYGPRMKRRIIIQVDSLMSTKKDGNVSEDEENQLNEAILASISDGSLQTGRSDINNESIIPKIIPPPPLNIEKPTQRNSLIPPIESPTVRGESCVTPIPVGAEWEAVRLYQAYVADTKLRNQQQQQLQKKKELADRLAEQVKENDERREREKQLAREEAERARKEYEKYREDTGFNYQKREKEIKELRDTWEQQIADWKNKLELEKETEKYEYEREIEELYESLHQEELYLKEKKEKERLINQESFEINNSNMNYKLNKLKEEKEREKQLNLEFMRIEEEKESAKKREFEERMAKLERYYNWAHTKYPRPVTPTNYILKRTEEERNQITNEEIQREINEREYKLNLDRKTRLENMILINQKKQENEEKLQREREYGMKLRNEMKEYEDNLKETRQKELQKKRSMGKDLLKQDHDGYYEIDRNIMTPIERSLNKDAIETVTNDPVLNSLLQQSRITHRMRMSLTSAGGPNGPGYISARNSLKRPSTSHIFA